MDDEWRPSRKSSNLKLKRSVSNKISLELYKRDGLIDHTNYDIISSHGLLLKKGIEKYKICKNMQLLTFIYSPDAIGGEIYFKNKNKYITVAKPLNDNSSQSWTWIVLKVPKLIELFTKPLTHGTKIIFTSEVKKIRLLTSDF